MNRRTFITSTTVVLASTVLAGCSEQPQSEPDGNGGGNGEQPTEPEQETTRTQTAEPTEEGSTEASVVIGELVKGDKLSMVVRDIQKTEQLDQFQKAEEGNTFVVVNLAVKNTTQSEFLGFSGFLQTRLKDSEGYTYQQALAATGKMLNDGELAPGEVSRGNIVYEVPKDASGLTLQFDFQTIAFFKFDRVTVDLSQKATSIADLTQNLRVPIRTVGEKVSYQGMAVTLNGAETANEIGYAEPKEGNEYVIVDITTTNNTGEEQYVSTLLQMILKDGAGHAYQEDISGTSQLDRDYEQGSPLADGETRRGKLAYEVETGVSSLYWVFEFSLLAGGDKTFWKVR